ncbi:phosphoserine phosphatase SerB [Archaeoglobus profundus]|uniref:phosphoserine phosphatase n=1 Tax=Archaeoglobus profundus (strain DSM 5631 / JCM 9629 / NBRC 100127 / Av18) TaxID=572546 RepID=D2REG8_ARCPA|nr:phosphoserine phosphatase SerB [Archaeoglobus profundus]ADB58512.1 phosphoserine phosphatase SerB [Archaeoglobus profundus DSM 5631]
MLIAVTVYGKDKKGIIYAISNVLADAGINIVDIEQKVLHGFFLMYVVADCSKTNLSFEEIRDRLIKEGKRLGMSVNVSKFERTESKRKNLYVITVLGNDRVGIVRDISKILLDHGVNIESTSLIARDKLISIEFVVDIGEADPEALKKSLKKAVESINLDIVIQPYHEFEREKRLIVFDMDSTLVDAEIIDEIAKYAGVEEEVKKITEKAMRGEIDFKTALIERVKLLKGLPVEVLEKIYENVKLTEGARELIQALKKAGYKVAVVSGGFTYFTNRLKEELGLDYAFGNDLEIKDGKLTGRLKGRIIDAEEKARIIEEIANREGISKENVVAVGDGANDRIMIENAGLGIAFNAKEVLKEVADGTISKENLIGLACVLGLFKKNKTFKDL